MAKHAPPPEPGSWLLVEMLFQGGDPAFVDELRTITDAERLGDFAALWYADPRPVARQLLLDYLGRPLNAFGHEPLVKRLFKRAEQAADDEVLARFLVHFDRSVRREQRKRRRHVSRTEESKSAAEVLLDQWVQEGYEYTNFWIWNNQYHVSGVRSTEILCVPHGTTMPRDNDGTGRRFRNPRTGAWLWKGRVSLAPQTEQQRQKMEQHRLFSVHTRNYLRRRAWRYFRKLGKQHPERYLPAVLAALKLYEDDDVADGLALLDNWGLMHVLFHHCPALVAKPHGWTLAPGHSLAELRPAPIYEALWKATPQALLALLTQGRCRPVRQWAVFLIRQDQGALLASLPLEEMLGLLTHDDAEVSLLAAEALSGARGLDALGLDRWLGLLETPHLEVVELLCDVMAKHVAPERITLGDAVRLAARRSLPVARLGLTWLRTKSPANADECRTLLGLAEAEAEWLRPEIVRWVRAVLSTSPHFQPGCVLEYLDSRHPDVRAEGWRWLQADDRLRDDVDVWCRLLESPYDDVRLLLVADLEDRVAMGKRTLADNGTLDPELLRFLWASVLLNIHRGGRAKPLVVRQLVRRLQARPEEASDLLPILGVALRSVRGPEWRAGLAAVVQLVEGRPELAALVGEKFPELKL